MTARPDGGAKPPTRSAQPRRVSSGRRFVERGSQREPAALAWELDLLVGLADAGFVVPRPVTATDGRLSVEGRWVAAFRPPAIR